METNHPPKPAAVTGTIAVLDRLPRGEDREVRIELRKGAGGFAVVVEYFLRGPDGEWRPNTEARGIALRRDELNPAAMALLRALEEIGRLTGAEDRDEKLRQERRSRIEAAYRRGVENATAAAARRTSHGGRRSRHRFVRDPWNRDRCDAKLYVDGRVTTCNGPRRDHREQADGQ